MARRFDVNALKLRLMTALVVGMEGVELGGLDLSRVRAVGERLGEIHPVGVLAVAVETIGDGLSDPGKDCREVEHEELGVEILLHGVGAEAGEATTARVGG